MPAVTYKSSLQLSFWVKLLRKISQYTLGLLGAEKLHPYHWVTLQIPTQPCQLPFVILIFNKWMFFYFKVYLHLLPISAQLNIFQRSLKPCRSQGFSHWRIVKSIHHGSCRPILLLSWSFQTNLAQTRPAVVGWGRNGLLIEVCFRGSSTCAAGL